MRSRRRGGKRSRKRRRRKRRREEYKQDEEEESKGAGGKEQVFGIFGGDGCMHTLKQGGTMYCVLVCVVASRLS